MTNLHITDFEPMQKDLARLRKREAALVDALTFVKTGPLASMLSAASDEPKGPDAMVCVPVSLIHHWNEVVSKALSTAADTAEKG